MDIFPEGNLVRDIQKELDEIIQQGVFQITKLLQNSETAISSKQPDEDTFTISQRKGNAYRGKIDYIILRIQPTTFSTDFKSSPMRGRLTERLLAQGLLTPSMLQELKKEWDKSEKSTRASNLSDDEDDEPPPLKPLRRKRTKK